MRTLFCILLAFWSLQARVGYAQRYFDDDKLLSNQTRIDFTGHGVHLVREIALNQIVVFDTGVGLGGGYTDLELDGLNPYWSLTNPAISLYANPKYYFYRKKVIETCELCFNNGGAFLGGRIRYVSSHVGDLYFTDLRSTLLSNVHLGFQMSGRSKTLFRGHLGLGYAATLHSRKGSFYRSVDVGISKILKNRKK
ncbi:hypothetical protein ADIS_0693 [Lunatimonas lonarensis]|uniref:Outer membrane protein beta-barrel domain-containing protein n=1 Tax=Lunatimonas lonarensis TaxID=1232681 RepID=R7ZXA4_9BACT|nr:hypothetical protein [Lunatimonas lonarensis]EON78796.1 hypothetical protein ADIS_0693 [Lunatimonas lonarensis]